MTDIAFFTRLLDAVPAAERYRLAIEQIAHAERHGFGRAWVAQHHFHAAEGGLPSPFVLLAKAAARTTSIRLGTAVVTLTLEDPIRVAEDAVVADLLSDGRIDLGVGSGSTPDSFVPFGLSVENKAEDYGRRLRALVNALAGLDVGAGNTLYPDPGSLGERVWQASFTPSGGERAGVHGHGLLLSRTQPREPGREGDPLHVLQLPIVDAYRNALPAGAVPRVTASRTVFVVDDREDAIRFARTGLRRFAEYLGSAGDASIEELVRRSDTHLGTPEEVAESLSRDAVLEQADEIAIQVHSVDAPHDFILRSLELFSSEVAPRFGWRTQTPALTSHTHSGGIS